MEYIDGQAASDEFTRELEDAVQSARRNEKWRLDSVKNNFFTRQIVTAAPNLRAKEGDVYDFTAGVSGEI